MLSLYYVLMACIAGMWAAVLLNARTARRRVEAAEKELDHERQITRILLGFGDDNMKLEELRALGRDAPDPNKRFPQLGLRVISEGLRTIAMPAQNFMYMRVGDLEFYVMKKDGLSPIALVDKLKADNAALREKLEAANKK